MMMVVMNPNQIQEGSSPPQPQYSLPWQGRPVTHLGGIG